MTQLYLVQMHGEPGAGKSTLARGIGEGLPAVVLDKDIISSALLKSGLARGSVGPASYETVWDLSASLLEQGYSVLVDSPAFWTSIQERGPGIARKAGAAYRMIEVYVDDPDEVERRLRSREALDSNPRRRQPLPAGAREPSGERLRLDGMRRVADLVEEALEYIRGNGRSGAPARGRNTDWTGRLRKGVENRGIWSDQP
jgi:predicted kinase